MDSVSLRKTPALRTLLDMTFPAYRGRTFSLRQATRTAFHDLHWSGGSRTEYILVNLDDGKTMRVANSQAPWSQFSLDAQDDRDMPNNGMVVEHVMFCGKDLGIRIVVHPTRYAAAEHVLAGNKPLSSLFIESTRIGRLESTPAADGTGTAVALVEQPEKYRIYGFDVPILRPAVNE